MFTVFHFASGAQWTHFHYKNFGFDRENCFRNFMANIINDEFFNQFLLKTWSLINVQLFPIHKVSFSHSVSHFLVSKITISVNIFCYQPALETALINFVLWWTYCIYFGELVPPFVYFSLVYTCGRILEHIYCFYHFSLQYIGDALQVLKHPGLLCRGIEYGDSSSAAPYSMCYRREIETLRVTLPRRIMSLLGPQSPGIGHKYLQRVSWS